MQEPVYVLHLITCHGRIMPRLAELLLIFTNLLANSADDKLVIFFSSPHLCSV